MSIKEFYEQTKSNYDEAINNLRKEERILKFVKMFIEDPSFEQCEKAFIEQNAQDAFLEAHTLKGVCMNMGFSVLCKSSSALTENLRDGKFSDESAVLFEQMKKDYLSLLDSIKELE